MSDRVKNEDGTREEMGKMWRKDVASQSFICFRMKPKASFQLKCQETLRSVLGS